MEGDKNSEFIKNYVQADPQRQNSEQEDVIDLAVKSPINRRVLKEKMITGAILATSFVAVLVGYWQISRAINFPFLQNLENSAINNTNTAETCVGGNCEAKQQLQNVLAMKTKDTDSDKLSDYDELYTYKTSPYLKDSDSDDYDDKQEVDGGFDPNCPGKETCFSSNASGTASINSQNTPAFQAGVNAQQPKFDLALMREMMIKSGADKTMIDSLSDSDLLTMIQQALGDDPTLANQLQQAGLDVSGLVGSGSAIVQNNATTTPTGNIDLSQLNVTSVNDLKNMFLQSLETQMSQQTNANSQ